MNKKQVIEAFLQKFKDEWSALLQSAKAAHQAATHEESRAEDRHDTFAIEASYLAAGQAARVAELQKTVAEFEAHLLNGNACTQFSLGALVSYRLDGQIHHSFVSILGGGSKVQVGDTTIQTLSLQSPLGETLEGAKAGEEVEFESRGKEKTYELISIA